MAEDEALALTAGRGDRAAFEALLARHYDGIFRLAWRVLGVREEAEDVTQDVCIRLAKTISGYRGDAKFRTWLHRITLNAARDAMRRRGTRVKAAQGYAEADAMARDEAKAKAGEQEWLRETLSGLKPELRETAALILGEEMTQAEAAIALDVAEGTIAWRMSELKKALREAASSGEDLTA